MNIKKFVKLEKIAFDAEENFVKAYRIHEKEKTKESKKVCDKAEKIYREAMMAYIKAMQKVGIG